MCVDRTLIRPATGEDVAEILAIYAPFVTDTPVSFEEEPPSLQEMRRRIERSHVWLVAQDEGRVVGYAYGGAFHPRSAYRWSAEVSVYLGKGSRGRGLGRRLVTAVLDELRVRGYVNAFAGTTLPNQASTALFEALGFVKIAHQHEVGFKLGAWHDVGWWQLHLRQRCVPPPDV